jgi:hypothetical protein
LRIYAHFSVAKIGTFSDISKQITKYLEKKAHRGTDPLCYKGSDYLAKYQIYHKILEKKGPTQR